MPPAKKNAGAGQTAQVGLPGQTKTRAKRGASAGRKGGATGTRKTTGASRAKGTSAPQTGNAQSAQTQGGVATITQPMAAMNWEGVGNFGIGNLSARQQKIVDTYSQLSGEAQAIGIRLANIALAAESQNAGQVSLLVSQFLHTYKQFHQELMQQFQQGQGQ